MKNKILTILILGLLSLPCYSEGVDDITNFEQPFAQEEVSPPKEQYTDLAVPQTLDMANYSLKQPVSKRKIVKKFLLAMGGVAASSFLIFFGLTLYNKIRESFTNQVKTPEGEISLETPEDLETAVKTFLDKTKWDK